MGEQEVVLEYHPARPPLGRDQHLGRRVVEDGAVEHDTTGGQRAQAGERPEQRGLATAVGPEYSQHLAIGHLELEVLLEGADDDMDFGAQAHGLMAPNQRPRRATRTTMEMAKRARDRATATCSFSCRAR